MGGNGAYKGKEIVRNQEKCPETEKAHTHARGHTERMWPTDISYFTQPI